MNKQTLPNYTHQLVDIVENDSTSRPSAYVYNIYKDNVKIPGLYAKYDLESLSDKLLNKSRYITIRELVLETHTQEYIDKFKNEYDCIVKPNFYNDYVVIFDKKQGVIRYKIENDYYNRNITINNNIFYDNKGQVFLLDDESGYELIFKENSGNVIQTATHLIIPMNQYSKIEDRYIVMIDTITGKIEEIH